MEKILDREIPIKEPSNWVTVFILNFIVGFIILFSCVLVRSDKEVFLVIGIGVILVILLNTIMTVGLLFSSSSNWKKWTITLLIILMLILGIALYLYLALKNW
jgi:uncharacterized membrane protein